MKKKLISIIVPVYNEEQVLPLFVERITNVINILGANYNCMVTFIDDGSKDSSWQIIQQTHKKDNRFLGIRLSRNFGHQAALTCGYEMSPGDALISLDSDLQDPPEVILDLVRHWEAGNSVVLAKRRSRQGETRFKLWAAKIHYRLISKLSETETPESVGDFRLMDRAAVDALKRITETHRYIRGLVGWLGFPRSEVEYDRAPREAGVTKYPFLKLLRLALDGIISFSFAPLRLAYLIAFLLMIPFLLFLSYSFIMYCLYRTQIVPGWTSLILSVILFGTFNIIMLGILGEYIGRIYTEVKRRPLFIIQDFCGQNDSIDLVK